jgi:hypothetical protein
VCTENLQLTGAKVSDPELRGNEAKLSRHFKDRISIENVGGDPWMVSHPFLRSASLAKKRM